MKKKRTYSSTDVERLDVAALMKVLTVGCIVAVDVAKTKFVAAIATATGEVLRIIRFSHPHQTLAFLKVVETLQAAQLAPRVVMEPTGTYGDAVRYQCHKLGARVEMMSPKRSHDFAEVVDGVPSMHDPKATVVLAQLAVLKPGRAWEPDSEARREVRALLDQRGPLTTALETYFGHLEAMMARHWPEFLGLIDVREQRSWMELLQHYSGPSAMAQASDEAAAMLRKASRGRLSEERVVALVLSAKTTLGVPMTKGEEAKLRFLVTQLDQHTKAIEAVDQALKQRVAKDDSMSSLAQVVGPACAASIVSHVGVVTSFESAGALEKAMGLNLKVKSSGETQGKVHITKRGPAQVRQLLFLAVLRLRQSNPIVAAWCEARKSYASDYGKKKAIVAVMRKLVRALFHVARGSTFDATKLFDTRRLNLPPAPGESPVTGSPIVAEPNATPSAEPRGAQTPSKTKAAPHEPPSGAPTNAPEIPQSQPQPMKARSASRPTRRKGGIIQRVA